MLPGFDAMRTASAASSFEGVDGRPLCCGPTGCAGWPLIARQSDFAEDRVIVIPDFAMSAPQWLEKKKMCGHPTFEKEW
jgi:hypothetical protein